MAEDDDEEEEEEEARALEDEEDELLPLPVELLFACFFSTSNLQSPGTSTAQGNLVSKLLLKIFSKGTCFRLHQAMVMRGSM